MTVSGFRTSTRGSRAARWNNASAAICGPGQMTPPRYSPFAVTASNVVAVPRSATISGAPRLRPYRSYAAMAVRDAIGADFRGVLVQDRHAGVRRRIDDQRRRARSIAATIAFHDRRQRRHDRGHARRRSIAARSMPLVSEQPVTIKPTSSAVRSRSVSSRQLAPACRLEDAEDDVGVADVDG